MFQLLLKIRFLLISLLISVSVLIFSVVLITYLLPHIIKNELYRHVSLIKHTDQFDRFVELPFPVTFKVYFFNVENPDEILNGSKPLVKEVGPYVYNQYRKKTIVDIDDDEDTISYTQRETFEFDSVSSGNLSDDDYITILNPPMISILQAAEKMHQTKVISSCLSEILPGLDTVFIKIKVKDILFNGLKFCPVGLSLCTIRKTVVCGIAATKRNVDKLKDGSLKFSFFNYKVRSDDGLYTVKRGIKNVQTLGNIVSLNNSTYTKFWGKNVTNCDKVEGTDSTLYPPGISKNSVFHIYSTDICRYMEIRFVQENSYHGIKGYTFGADNSTLRSSTTRKEDDCFCANETKGVNGENTCFLDGIIDIQPCTGAPVLLSFPHFLWANKSYEEAVDGLKPNRHLHETFVTIEPETGTPLQGMKRAQLNAVLRPIKNIKQMDKVPKVVLPLIWIEEVKMKLHEINKIGIACYIFPQGVSLSSQYIDELNEMYFEKVKIANLTKWTLLGLSTLFTIIISTYLLTGFCKSKNINYPM